MTRADPSTRRWAFLTNHAVVYLHLFEHSRDTIRQIADHLRMADRTVAGVLADLRKDGYLTVTKVGRRNTYAVNPHLPLKRLPYNSYTAAEFFALLAPRAQVREQKNRRTTSGQRTTA